jgi:NAD(P)-dependent dehydrogenase (short-subunit alcohol dehydrogenase family)
VSALGGRRVWLTGASSGIGAALATELSRRGAMTAVTARREDDLRALPAPTGLRVEPGDVTDPARIARIVQDLERDWGAVDLAVLNAGVYEPVVPEDFRAEVFRLHLDVNIMGTVNCIEALLPGMRTRGGGRIAVTASVTGYAGLPLASAYGATKAFLISMCDSLRADLASSGVGVTVIAPGFVRTPLTAQNDFRMPGIIAAAAAARIICDGLEDDRDEIGVPRKALAFMKGLARLPAPLRRRYVARIAARREADRTTGSR